jgi:flotillin
VVEAEASAERRKIEAEGHAKAAQIEAQGEAAAIYARLEAKARGEYEILVKKAEGLKEIINGCGGVQAAFQMLMLEHFDHLAETSARALSNIKFDKITVWDSGNQNGSGGAAGFLQSLGRSLPPLLDIMKNLGGVELPGVFGELVEEGQKDGQAAPGSTATSPRSSPS